MKIGIDARLLGHGYGIGRYIEQLIKHLEKIDGQNQYFLFLQKKNWDLYTPLRDNFHKILADIPWYGWKEQIKLPAILARHPVDLMHFPHWNVPLFYRRPFVVTIHDLIMYHYPRPEATTLGAARYFIKDKIHRLIVRQAVGRARKIFVTSEFTKQDVQKTLGMPADKMIVTYQAPTALLGAETKTDLPTKYQINKPYLLYVGTAYPHKNLDTLLSAWKIFQEKYSRDYQLVLVGKKNYFYNRLQATAYSLPSSNIVFTGFVPEPELPAFYQNSSLFVLPSLYEGFGLPALEAIQCGLPVASSSASCLPEVLQDAAAFFDPRNPEEIATILNQALTDKNLRAKLIAAGNKISSFYSWERLARQTQGVYLQTVDKSA